MNGNGNGNGNGAHDHGDGTHDAVPGMPRPAADLQVPPVAVAPGEPVETVVSVTNRRARPCAFALTVVGLEPGWASIPPVVGPLGPGEQGQVVLQITLPRGHPPAALLCAVEARPLPEGAVPAATPNGNGASRVTNGSGPAAASGRRPPAPGRPGAVPDDERRAPALVDVRIVVGDGAAVSARLEPGEVRGTHRGRFDVVLRNRGAQSQQVTVTGVAPDPALSVRLSPASPLLLPGHEVRVAGRLRGRRPFAGEPVRRPFGVRVQGRGTPVVVEGSFISRAVLPAWATKAVAVLLVIALWVAVAVVAIGALSSHLHRSAELKATVPKPPAVHVGVGHGTSGSGSGSHSGSAGPSHGGGTSTGHGSAGKSSAGTSSGKSSTGTGTGSSATSGSGGAAAAASTASTVEVAGKVSGSAPGGVTVTLSPTSLVSPAVLGATTAPTTSTDGAVRRAGPTGSRGATEGPRRAGPVTDAAVWRDGRPVTGPVPAGGGHTATAGGGDTAGAGGRNTAGAVLDAALPDGKAYGTSVAAAVFPGLGAGTSPTLTTQTAPDGSFVFTGVTAPGTYLLSFTESGYNSRKYVVQAAQGQNVTLNTSLTPGTGSVSGQVVGPDGPLGGVTVTVSDGSVTLTTVTPTTGSGVGTWSVTGLNTPDTYLVSASAPGYGTQSTSETLGPSASVAGVDLTLQPGVGSISGTVTGAASGQPLGGVTVTATNGTTTATATTSTASPVGAYLLPDLAVPGSWTVSVSGTGWVTQTQQVTLTGNSTVNASLTSSAANVVGVVSSSTGGLANVGLTLSNQSETYKTLSESVSPTGGFDFGQVPPGQYVLTATAYGYTTESAPVSVASGQTQTVDLTMPYVGQADVDTATIDGTVQNVDTGNPVAGVPIELDGRTTAATTNAEGAFTLTDVAPGLHSITAVGSSQNYTTAQVQVSVAQGATVVAPILNLSPLSTLTGTVLSAADGAPVPNPTVELLLNNQVLGPPVETSSTATGTFTVTGISAGSYILKVSATGYETSQTAVSLGVGQNLTDNVTLTLGPLYSVETYLATAGGPQPLTGVCVQVEPDSDPSEAVTQESGSGSSGTGAAATLLTFPNLVSGDAYTASFAVLPTGDPCSDMGTVTPVDAAPDDYFEAAPDNTSIYPAVLSPVYAGVSVDLSFPYVEAATAGGSTGTTIDCPVDDAGTSPCPTVSSVPTVELTGTVGYGIQSDGNPGAAQTATVTLCAPGPGSDQWSWPTAATCGGGTAPPSFLNSQVTLVVSDAGGPFEELSTTVTLATAASTSSSQVVDELLTPVPVPVAGTLSPTTGVTGTVSPSVIPPSGTAGTANNLTTIDDVAVIEGGGGQVQWSDPATGVPGTAEPGLYTVTLAATGYDSSGPLSVSVPLCPTTTSGDTCPTPVTLSSTLPAEVTLQVTPASATVPSGLPEPTVTVDYDGSTVSTQALGADGSASFTDVLSPSQVSAAATAGDAGFTYTVSGPGIQTYTSGTLALVSPSNATLSGTTLTATPSLVLDGWATGTVQGDIVPGASGTGATETLGDATVTATLTGSCPTSGNGDMSNGDDDGGGASPAPGYASTLTATTASDGTFTLGGSSAGGLCPGGDYSVTVSAPGYTSTPAGSATTLDVGASGGAVALGTLTVDAAPITQVVEVTVASAGTDVTVAASSPLGPTVTCTVATTAGATGTCSGTGASATGDSPATGTDTFTFSLDPTSYSFALAAPEYEDTTLGPEPYEPGTVPATLSYTLVEQTSTVTGTVTASADGGSAGAVPIVGLPLSLVPNAGNGATAIATTDTGSGGAYTFTGVPNGAYVVEIGDDYTTTAQVTFSTDYPTPVNEDFTVEAPPTPVTVAVTDPTASQTGSSADGTTVTLTPESGASVPVTCGTGASASTLLVAGLGSQETATAGGSASSATASFSDVVPDVYDVTVTGTGLPPQATSTLTVCPSGASSPASPAVALQVGEISVQATLDPSASPTVTVTATPTTGTALSATCTPSGGTCTADLLVDLDTAYTVTVSAEGYDTVTDHVGGSTLTTSSPTDPLTATLDQADVTLTLTAGSSDAAVDAAMDGATVKLTPASGSAGAGGVATSTTADSDGVATFATVQGTATPGVTYDMSVTPNGLPGATTQSLATTVQVVTGTPVVTTASVETGTISGTVTLAGTAPTTSVTVTVTVPGPGTTTETCGQATVAAGTSSASYTCVLPPGSYTPSFAAGGYTTTAAGSASPVSSGIDTSGVDVTLPTS